MKRIRILLADDHPVVRRGFQMILAEQSDREIGGEAGNGREALELAAKLKPDVVVMDFAMPELNGIEATRRMAESAPHARVLALSMHKDSVYVRETLRAGARGYLLKDSVAADLVSAVRAVRGFAGARHAKVLGVRPRDSARRRARLSAKGFGSRGPGERGARRGRR